MIVHTLIGLQQSDRHTPGPGGGAEIRKEEGGDNKTGNRGNGKTIKLKKNNRTKLMIGKT